MRKLELWVIVCVPPLVCAGVAVGMGLDANWDLRNYHYYNAYAFLTDRQALDVAPGQRQTFMNPLLDLPFHWMAQAWPPVWVGAALGAVHGLNLTLLALLFNRVTRWPDARSRWGVGLLLLWLSLRGPGFLSELGTTMNDNLVSLFVLLALLLLVRAAGGTGRAAWGQVALAGCIMGAGVGLKPAVVPYALGSGVALPWLWSAGRARWQAFAIYGLVGVAGTLATTGFWWWEMWVHYGNPFFPYLNHVFRSPYIQASSYADTRFLPVAWWEYLAWPLIFSANGQRVAEQPFSDVRFGVLYFLVWLLVGLRLIRRLRRAGPPQSQGTIVGPEALRFLAAFAGVSFVVWMGLFSIYRYLIPLELLVPLLALAALDGRCPPRVRASKRAPRWCWWWWWCSSHSAGDAPGGRGDMSKSATFRPSGSRSARW